MREQRYETPNSILKAARELSLDDRSFRLVHGGRALKILNRVFASFTVGGAANRAEYWLWQDFSEPCVAFHGPHELATLLSLGPPGTLVWLLVEDEAGFKEGPPFWVFETTLSTAVAVLKNHHLLEFYIVSRNFDWLISENHHDVLFAVGNHAVSLLEASYG
jgi:hypothetical protein